MGADQYSVTYTVPTLSLIGCGQEIVLPVEMLTFEAHCNDAQVKLSWSTATETNNDFYTLERSENAHDWAFVANMDGAGNTNSISHYTYTDHPEEPGPYYYRLWQTDYDGRLNYLGMVAAPCDPGSASALTGCFPNPFKDEVTITFTENIPASATIEIWDMMGKQHLAVVLTQDDRARGKYLLKTDQLGTGVYLLKFCSVNSCETFRIVKCTIE
jgi:hypothetical protein